MKASEVVEAKRGFCNNKSTLFVALCRGAGIPARQVFVDLSKEILHGGVNPRTPYVDHSFSEVYLDNQWIRLDSYIVDNKLFKAAQKKLKDSGRRIGWGVHSSGSNQWDGKSDSFSQFVAADAKNISTNKEPRVYEDVGDFYKNAKNPWNKANFIQNIVFFFLANKFSTEFDKLRQEAP